MRSTDFRKVYDRGKRHSCAFFAAFCLVDAEIGAARPVPGKFASEDVSAPQPSGPRIGFTTPRALGPAVQRNRIRRRVREAARLQLELLNPQWSIVINPRRAAATCPFPELVREVGKLFQRCNEL